MMISPPGVSQILFNVDALESDRDTLIITEGEFDTIALAHATDLPVVSALERVSI